jgi:protein-disulfide isomerase
MLSLRAAVVVGITALLGTKLTTCRSPGEGGSDPNPGKPEVTDVTLKGVDTSDLTTREKADWSRYVTEFLAPCPDQPVSLAQCVNEARPCKACVPAARYLKLQARRGRVRAQVEASYRARFAPEAVKNIDVSGAPAKGAASPSVLIAEFADFECPACAGVRPVLDETIEKYPGEVRLVFKHFPLAMHPNAEKAARAAVAAFKQNKFWDMHRVLFENQRELAPDNVEKLARELGLDMKRFVQDRDSEATADAVARDRKQGEALDISSTPSLFINGRQFPPTPDLHQDLEEWIKLEIELLKGEAPKPAPKPPAPSAAAPSAAAAPAPPPPSAAAAPAPPPPSAVAPGAPKK